MAEGNFAADGKLENVGKATGATDKVAEGLGGANIKGISDPKVQNTDAVTKETGRKEKSMPQNTAAGVGFDEASDGAVSIMERPEGGRLNDAQGQATVTGDPKTALRDDGKTSVAPVPQ